MWASLHYVGFWLTLLLAVPAAGFLVRLFMIQHDCGHDAFFRRRVANDWVGRVIGVLTLTPYDYWRRRHATHHATSGNLDGRGIGDVATLTVEEYLGARTLGALWLLAEPSSGGAVRRRPDLYLPAGAAAADRADAGRLESVGQHDGDQSRHPRAGGGPDMAGRHRAFPDDPAADRPASPRRSASGCSSSSTSSRRTHWAPADEWSHAEAALHGSSHYDLPGVLRWFSANIGMHHVHHLASRIPFYRLPEVLRSHPELRDLGRLTLWQSLACVRLALWDEGRRRLDFLPRNAAPQEALAGAGSSLVALTSFPEHGFAPTTSFVGAHRRRGSAGAKSRDVAPSQANGPNKNVVPTRSNRPHTPRHPRSLRGAYRWRPVGGAGCGVLAAVSHAPPGGSETRPPVKAGAVRQQMARQRVRERGPPPDPVPHRPGADV